MEIEEENKEFHRIMGEILTMALAVESYLEFFIVNYFVKPQTGKTHFLNDSIILKIGFDRKIQLFKDICKREKFDKEVLEKVLEYINFVKDTRNKVAHWQGEKMFDKPIRLRKRTSFTTKDDILELNDSLSREMDENRLKAIKGIRDFYLKYSDEGTIDERPGNWDVIIK